MFFCLAATLLYLFLGLPLSLTLDGYSHLYGAEMLKLVLAGEPALKSTFQLNSWMVPNWVDALLLMGFSSVFSSEVALQLLTAIIATMLLLSLYSCVDTSGKSRRQRAQILIVMLAFSINAFLTLGFYGFLISTALCNFVLGMVLRHGLRMSWGRQCLAAGLLMIGYFSHPIPVIISFQVPVAAILVDAVRTWREGGGGIIPLLRSKGVGIWPWLGPAMAFPVFYFRLVQESALHEQAPATRWILTELAQRLKGLAGGAFVSTVAPTASVGTLFVALLSVLVAGLLHSPRKGFAQNTYRMASMGILFGSTMLISLLVPDHVGDGTMVVARFWLLATLFLVLLSLASGDFDARLLTLSSLLAAGAVLGFAAEYRLVASRLAPQAAELKQAMETIPKHERILILGYRLAPSYCQDLPLMKTVSPERHWALAAALKNELIVLNDYQAHTSHFPLRYAEQRYRAITDELLGSEEPLELQKRAAWAEILSTEKQAQYVVSWGVARRPGCSAEVPIPMEEHLQNRYERVLFGQGSSDVAVWRKRE